MKFSIVTINKNNLIGLQRTVTSVKRQSYLNWEQIIKDGGSTDGSIEYLKSVASNNIRIFLGGDKGIYDAMNIATSNISGDIVLYLHAGDELVHMDVLKLVSNSVKSEQWKWAYGNLLLTSPSLEVFKEKSNLVSLKGAIYGRDFYPHQSCFFDVEFFQKNLGRYSLDFGTMADQEICGKAHLLSKPIRLKFAVSVFPVGGLNAQVSILKREWLLHKIRKSLSQCFLNSIWLDLGLSLLLSTHRSLRHTVRRSGFGVDKRQVLTRNDLRAFQQFIASLASAKKFLAKRKSRESREDHKSRN